jgi:glycosyltransferase involved in cell wall biosynthesis
MNFCLIRHAYFPDDPRDRKQAFALIEAGHAVDVLCLKKKDQSAYAMVNGVRVFRIPLTHKRLSIQRYFIEYMLSFILFSGLLLPLFFKMRYARIQVSTMPDFLVFTTILPKLLGARVLLDLHEPVPELWITKYGERYGFLLMVQKKIEKAAIGYADACSTVTKQLRERFGERGADINKISVIPNVCEEIFDQRFSTATQVRHDSDGRFRLVTHGLIEERYGHEIVVRALEHLGEELSSAHFYIYGDGEYKPELIEKVNRSTCKERIHFLGFVSFDELIQDLLLADVAVIPTQKSPYSELVDTNKMYEYIALHKPVIASRLAAVEENFDDEAIMFFQPGSHRDLAGCIRELFHSKEKRSSLVKNAYYRYSKMCWSETKVQYVTLVEGKQARLL